MPMPMRNSDREPLPAGVQHVSEVMAAVLKRRLALPAEERSATEYSRTAIGFPLAVQQLAPLAAG